MKLKITMLADVGERKMGEEYELEEAVADALIAGKLAEEVEPEDEDLAAEVKSLIESAITSTVEKTVKGMTAGSTTNPVVTQVHETLADDPTGGFTRPGEFLKAVAMAARPGGGLSEKLGRWYAATKTAGHMSEGDDSQGGFLVPTQFIADLMMNTIIDDGIPSRCTIIPMQTNTVSIPYLNETTHATSVYGGVQVKRTGEAAEKIASKPTVGKLTMTLHKLTILTYVSDELLEDSPISIEPLFRKMFPEALNFTLADDILNGTGAGMGMGVVPAPATITVARAGAGAIAWADVINMWSRLYARSAGNSVWFANNDAFPQLATMTQVVGVGGVAVYIPANGASATPYGTLMGRPLILTELAQTMGTAGDLILADLSQMLLGRKAGSSIKFGSSIHLHFDYNETAFKAEMRYDCQPWWAVPLTPRYSANTVSPFVILGDAT